jgi:hypothetical protein
MARFESMDCAYLLTFTLVCGKATGTYNKSEAEFWKMLSLDNDVTSLTF